jgi:hypothetical protein
MKKAKIFFTLFLSGLFLSMSFSNLVNAEPISTSYNKVKLITIQVPSDVTNFTLQHFGEELQIINKNPDRYGFNSKEISNFTLGQPFNIYFYQNNKLVTSNNYCYPVLYNNTIKGIFSITKISDGKYTGALSRSFGDTLQQLSINNNCNFRIVSMNGDLFAIDSNKSVLLHKDKDKKLESNIITSSELNKINKGITNSTNKENTISANSLMNSKYFQKQLYNSTDDSPVDSLTSHNLLYVPIVLQGNHPWCWAATDASMINYFKGTFYKELSAQDVVEYIYGSPVDEGGDEAQICQADTHWGLTPKVENGVLTFSTFQHLIDSNEPVNGVFGYIDPVHGFEGHSMSMIGYDTYSSGDKYYAIIDPNEDYYIALTANDSGCSVVYYLDGDPFTWIDSIIIQNNPLVNNW